MDKLQFLISMHAPKEKVWETLWADETYRKWTSVFMEGSHAESDWQEGSKILFLGPKGEGMFGIIQQKIPYQQMTFKHLGEVKNGVEEKKDWGDAIESYHLEEKNGITTVNVTLNSPFDMAAYFNETFPKALEILKDISEV